MAFKMKYKNLQGVVDQLRGAVKAHGKQADIVEKHIDKMKKGFSKKLVGDQDKLPKELQAEIKAASPLAKKSKGRKVSWKYGGKTYYGTLIPSMETSTHRYARTHNGKIKSLPKKKKK
tara:strand:- start:335 stop:688 length:354 start_codon:yes stop_codon:yes gene_type:complete